MFGLPFAAVLCLVLFGSCLVGRLAGLWLGWLLFRLLVVLGWLCGCFRLVV